MERLPCPSEERYLVIDDTDEDVSQILTIICDGRPRAARSDVSDLCGGAP
jgi:hypothetical protein